MLFVWAVGLDVTQGSFEAGGTLVEMTIDADVSKFPVLEAGFMIVGVVTSERCIIVTANSPDFGASDSDFFFLGQGKQ